MDDEPEAEQGLGVVRRHHEDLLRGMAIGFSDALSASGWAVPDILHQTRVYPEVVQPITGRIAYFFVDAMRFEMGVDVAEQLQQVREVSVRPAIAALPSITPLGMGALLPEASASYSAVEAKHGLAAKIQGTTMPSLKERMLHLRAVRPDAKDLDLGELLQRSMKSLARTLDGVPLLVVRSQSIDGLGEMDGGLLARHIMDTVVGNVARAIAQVGETRLRCGRDHSRPRPPVFGAQRSRHADRKTGWQDSGLAPSLLGRKGRADTAGMLARQLDPIWVTTRTWSSFSPEDLACSRRVAT